jgi:hypothetical protein
MPCSTYMNRRFGGTYRLYLQGRRSDEEEISMELVTRQSEDEGNTFFGNVDPHTE